MNSGRNTYFPLFVDMAGKTVLFAGGGKITERRITALLSVLKETSGEKKEGELQIIVVSPEVTGVVDKCVRDGYIWWKRRKFSASDVDNVDFVIAATDCADTNEAIVNICHEKGIPVNDAGNKKNCDFYFPGIAVKGDIVAGITASGTDHKLTKKVTEAVRELLNHLMRQTR